MMKKMEKDEMVLDDIFILSFNFQTRQKKGKKLSHHDYTLFPCTFF